MQKLYLNDDPQYVIELKERGFQLELSSPLQHMDFYRSLEATFLYRACMENKVSIIKALLQQGVNPNKGLGAEGAAESPLIIACKMGHEKAVAILLDYKADVNKCNVQQWSPLLAALESNSAPIIQHLLKKTTLDATIYDKTLLQVACEKGLLTAVRNWCLFNPSIKEFSKEVNGGLQVIVKYLLSKKFFLKNEKKTYLHILEQLLIALNPREERLHKMVYHFISNGDAETASHIAAYYLQQQRQSQICLKLQETVLQMFLTSAEEEAGLEQTFLYALAQPLAAPYANVYIPEITKIDKIWLPAIALLIYCFQQDIEAVEKLLESDESLIAFPAPFLTPMEIACFKGNTALVFLLLKDKRQEINENPLALAACYGQSPLVKTLLMQKQFSVQSLQKAFNRACIYKQATVAQVLLNHETTVPFITHDLSKSLSDAVTCNCISLIKNIIALAPHTADALFLAFFHSIKQNQTALAQSLLEENSTEFNIHQSYKGYTPLYWACFHNNENLVDALINNGTIVDTESLTICCAKGHLHLVKKLFALCPIISPDWLVAAAKEGYLPIVKYLIKQQVNVNQSRIREPQLTPLDAAIKRGHLDIVRVLLGHNASTLNLTRNDNVTPLIKDMIALRTQYICSNAAYDPQTRRDITEEDINLASNRYNSWSPTPQKNKTTTSHKQGCTMS